MTNEFSQIGLTKREIEFLSLEVDGLTNIEISQRCEVPLRWVKKVKQKGREKLKSHGLCLPSYRQEKRPTVILVDFA